MFAEEVCNHLGSGKGSLTHVDEGEITEKKVHWGVQSRVCDGYEDDKDVSQDRSSIKQRRLKKGRVAVPES